MVSLPQWTIAILSEFAPAIYTESTWYKVEMLVAGAILATGKRTVSAILRVMGLSQDRNYAMYHHVLSRAAWSGLEISAILLRVLLQHSDGADLSRIAPIAWKAGGNGLFWTGFCVSPSHRMRLALPKKPTQSCFSDNLLGKTSHGFPDICNLTDPVKARTM